MGDKKVCPNCKVEMDVWENTRDLNSHLFYECPNCHGQLSHVSNPKMKCESCQDIIKGVYYKFRFGIGSRNNFCTIDTLIQCVNCAEKGARNKIEIEEEKCKKCHSCRFLICVIARNLKREHELLEEIKDHLSKRKFQEMS